MPSTRARVWVTSLTLAAVVTTLSGVPCPSRIRWCLLPVFRGSTGDGPVSAPPFFARTWKPSTHARDQSSSPAVLSPASRMWCNRSKAPACCHRSSRRQQVCPEPKPSYRGRSCQAMSLQRTYRTPCRQSLSATGRGPGDRSGQGGSSGSISAHKSSSTIHGRVLTASRTAESSHQPRPTRAPQQDRVTGSKGTRQELKVSDPHHVSSDGLKNLRIAPFPESIPSRYIFSNRIENPLHHCITWNIDGDVPIPVPFTQETHFRHSFTQRRSRFHRVL